MYEIKFDFLLLICLTSIWFLDQREEPWRVEENASSLTSAKLLVTLVTGINYECCEDTWLHPSNVVLSPPPPSFPWLLTVRYSRNLVFVNCLVLYDPAAHVPLKSAALLTAGPGGPRIFLRNSEPAHSKGSSRTSDHGHQGALLWPRKPSGSCRAMAAQTGRPEVPSSQERVWWQSTGLTSGYLLVTVCAYGAVVTRSQFPLQMENFLYGINWGQSKWYVAQVCPTHTNLSRTFSSLDL